MRSKLAEANLEASFDMAESERLVQEARTAFGELRPYLGNEAARVDTALNRAEQATRQGDAPALAWAGAQAWTALLAGANRQLESAVTAGNVNTARGATGWACASTTWSAA